MAENKYLGESCEAVQARLKEGTRQILQDIIRDYPDIIEPITIWYSDRFESNGGIIEISRIVSEDGENTGITIDEAAKVLNALGINYQLKDWEEEHIDLPENY